MINDELKTWF